VIAAARSLVLTYEDMAELIRLSAYNRGSDARVDEAMHRVALIEAFLGQEKAERADLAGGYDQLTLLLQAPTS
jgi:flagellum-specific ATP synthase